MEVNTTVTVSLNWYTDIYEELFALREAVEILEDRLEFEKGRGDGWRDAATDWYKETRELKQERRESYSTAKYSGPSGGYWWTIGDEIIAHNRTKGALKDAEAKVAELHVINERQASEIVELRACFKNAEAERLSAYDRALKYARDADRAEQERDEYAARLNAEIASLKFDLESYQRQIRLLKASIR